MKMIRCEEVEAQATPTDEESDVGLLEELELQVFGKTKNKIWVHRIMLQLRFKSG